MESERRRELRDYLADIEPDAVLLDGEEFDGGLVGVSSDGRAVYSYASLIDSLSAHNGWTEDDAAEWIDYNTVRSLPYMGAHAPVIVFDIPEELVYHVTKRGEAANNKEKKQ